MRIKRLLFRHKIKLAVAAILLVWYIFCLPEQLFNAPYSTVIESRNGRLLDAHIAQDDQWRFPAVDSVPYRYEQALLQYEDAHFYEHPGFNPVAIVKAMSDNISAGEVVRGGSTITQQVIRLSRKRDRTYTEKFIELIWATRLEWKLSKKEILELYASHAPYGGNVVGLEMAAWRYFGRKPHELSWAESAVLAVLPNAPGLIYPGRRESDLKDKRDQLLLKMHQEGILTAMDYELAISEEMPTKDFKVPQLAPHLLQRVLKEHGSTKMRTSIDHQMQEQVNSIVANHHAILQQNGVNNVAMLVLNVKERSVAAYVGNAPTTSDHQKDVDIITAPRSTGSVLKPLLYANMLDHGELLPHTLVRDIPTVIDGFSTENYDRTYQGAVPASQALARSLNVPAVRMLRQHSVPRFYNKLQTLQLRDIDRGPGVYGLSLIIGGGESSLWDMSRAYMAMANTLQDYTTYSSQYDPEIMDHLSYRLNNKKPEVTWSAEPTIYGAGSIYHSFEAMKKVNRPAGEEVWHFFHPDRDIAWKTGTSFGNRDAWAIGVTPDYVIGVWTGNADGEGRAEMTGIGSAAPILFDLFNRLPTTKWFDPPYDDMIQADICQQSGHLASPICPIEKQWIPSVGSKFTPCPYHKKIHLDASGEFQVNADCEPLGKIQNEPWFVLPAVMSYYYSRTHPDYKKLPEYRADCTPGEQVVMKFIQPMHNTSIPLTKNVEGKDNKVVFKLAHISPEHSVYWYMDDEYLGTTKNFHELAIKGKKGRRLITAMDEDGHDTRIYVNFE
ncbi:penicillin-binding protein 1C [Nonlabens xiamenensis]|uniref:penicillin-binding protein 1C n=1 Tax=Nonlabens xiamenensis TaxID=2341043 RepID=UPI00197D20F6|nr:penicillin-binding protein 1C [Nonlabens xiamenensis]